MSQLPALAKGESPEVQAGRKAMAADFQMMANEYTDRVRADGEPAAYRDWFATLAKVVPGIQSDPRNGYENLPMISITFGDSFATKVVASTPIKAMVEDPIADIEDAAIKTPTLKSTPKPNPVPEPMPVAPKPVLDADAQELMDLLNIH